MSSCIRSFVRKKIMNKVYPIYISHDDKGYYVSIPDFKSFTEGNSLDEAVYMGKDAICTLAVTMEDLCEEIPAPFSVDYSPTEDETIAYVDVDFKAYRRAQNMKNVRKTVTIPEWLYDLAMQKGLNLSQLLRDKLKESLKL